MTLPLCDHCNEYGHTLATCGRARRRAERLALRLLADRLFPDKRDNFAVEVRTYREITKPDGTKIKASRDIGIRDRKREILFTD